MERLYSRTEIEQWFENARSVERSGWSEQYSFGYGQGIVAVMIAFDDYRRLSETK